MSERGAEPYIPAPDRSAALTGERAKFEAWYDAQKDGRLEPWDVWQAALHRAHAEALPVARNLFAAIRELERARDAYRGAEPSHSRLQRAVDDVCRIGIWATPDTPENVTPCT